MARNLIYSSGLLSPSRLGYPVISVGNLTLGGAGKTPMVIHIAGLLQKMGVVPALLSRGYGRESPNISVLMPPGDEPTGTHSDLGDEPTLIRRHVPGIWLGISKDRLAMGRRICAQGIEPIFVLDDGFQHRPLHRDVDIVMIDLSQPLARNRLLPLGTLREPLKALRRANVVILHGADRDSERDAVERLVLGIHPRVRIFGCRQHINRLIPFLSWESHDVQDRLDGIRRAFLVAAIGNPERFRKDVQRLGVSVDGTRFFRDHYKLNYQDWVDCATEARRIGAEALITTEKDAVKLTEVPDFPLLVSMQSIELLQPEEFAKLLKRVIRL